MRGKRGFKRDLEAIDRLLADIRYELSEGIRFLEKNVNYGPELALRMAEGFETILNDLKGRRVAKKIPEAFEQLDPAQGRIVEEVARAEEKQFENMFKEVPDFADQLKRFGWEGHRTTDPAGVEVVGIFDPSQVLSLIHI